MLGPLFYFKLKQFLCLLEILKIGEVFLVQWLAYLLPLQLRVAEFLYGFRLNGLHPKCGFASLRWRWLRSFVRWLLVAWWHQIFQTQRPLSNVTNFKYHWSKSHRTAKEIPLSSVTCSFQWKKGIYIKSLNWWLSNDKVIDMKRF